MLNYRAPTLLDSHPLSFHGFQGLSRADKAQSCGKSGRALCGLTRAPLVGESGGQSSGTHPWGNKAAWRGSELELGGWHSSGTWRRRQWPVAHGLGGLRRLPGSPEALDSAGEGRHQPTSNVVFTVFVALTSEASSTRSRVLEDHTGLCTRVAPCSVVLTPLNCVCSSRPARCPLRSGGHRLPFSHGHTLSDPPWPLLSEALTGKACETRGVSGEGKQSPDPTRCTSARLSPSPHGAGAGVFSLQGKVFI